MHWDRIRNEWSRLRPKARSVWPRVSEAELEIVAGRRDRLVDKVRAAYHLPQEEAEREVDVWAEGLRA